MSKLFVSLVVFPEEKVLLAENRTILQHCHLKSNEHLQPRTTERDGVIWNVWGARQRKSEQSSKHFVNNASLIFCQESVWEFSDMFGRVSDAVKLCQQIQAREALILNAGWTEEGHWGSVWLESYLSASNN